MSSRVQRDPPSVRPGLPGGLACAEPDCLRLGDVETIHRQIQLDLAVEPRPPRQSGGTKSGTRKDISQSRSVLTATTISLAAAISPPSRFARKAASGNGSAQSSATDASRAAAIPAP
jgi:hypothetical protein